MTKTLNETQRIIKFRAWGAKNPIVTNEDEMIYDIRLGHFEELNDFFDGRALTFMQFTGLHDKNGVEIYEGDLFGQMSGDTERLGEYEMHGRVYFDQDCASFVIDTFNGGWQHLDEYVRGNRSGKVIGNIYQNPELLK